ncbi:hypothetical protein HY967_02825 [Candidatus Jorgensenbacteria bacterium]|nr:hypothetical protein [Candidatus Jorgensenbacteria bacterium]
MNGHVGHHDVICPCCRQRTGGCRCSDPGKSVVEGDKCEKCKDGTCNCGKDGKRSPVDKSELQLLLEKNLDDPGLTDAEYSRAMQLILESPLGEEDCSVCTFSTPDDVNKSICDTGLCKPHAQYALNTRK